MSGFIDSLERRTLLAAVTVNINTQQTFQTIEGLGAAMIPWKLQPEYTDPRFFDLIVNDLGASMARAAVLPTAEPVNDNNDPNSFNWSAFDREAVEAPFTFFQKLAERGVNRFVGSVWTAPAWMKTNQIYTDGGALRPDMRGEFAEYLSAITQIAKNDYGVNLMAVSVQNEPYFVEPYESTTYNAEQLREAVRAVMRKFNADGVTTKILLPEDLIFEDRVGWYVSRIMNDPETKNFNGAFAGHGLLGHWNEIRDTLAPHGRQFWMTETSGNTNTWEGAMGLANGIMNALGTANASTYLYWQFSETTSNLKQALMENGQPTLKYIAAKHWYRYIRPGFVKVSAESSFADQLRVATFRNPSTGAMTTVIVNRDGDTHDVTFNLAGSNLPGNYKVFRSSATAQWQSLGTITGGSSFTMTVPGLNIVTITNAPELTPKTGGAVHPTVNIDKISDFVSTNNFFKAALKGYGDSLTSQINGGANVNQVAANGWTPIHAAAGSVHNGSLNTTNILIANGANVNALNNEGWTPVHAAAANTFSKFGASATLVQDKINALLNAGANVNAKDVNGRTPLHWAAWLGKGSKFTEDPGIVNALLARGANPFLKDNFGKTALDYALAEGYDRVGDALIKAMGTDTTKPTADIIDVSPDPRNTSVTDFTIKFSERVKGFDMSDLVLTRNGITVGLPVPELLTTQDDITFKLSGMGGLTAAPGSYVLKVRASGSGITDPSDNPLAADATESWSVTTQPPPPPPPPGVQSPFKGSPFAIGSTPTIIEFEDFDNGGEGTAYHDTDATNQGGGYRTTGVDLKAVQNDAGAFFLGYTKVGEWGEYTINVASAGAYDFDFRVASSGIGGTFHLEVDGANVTGALAVPGTGGWQTWKTFSKTNVNLPAGQHVLRLMMDALGPSGAIGNFNYVSIKPSGGTPPPPPPPPPPSSQTPFKGSPFAIVPSSTTTIEAEDFDNGGEGVAYHDFDSGNFGGASYRTSGVDIQTTSDAGGGYNIGYTKAGEWLEYTINVQSAGTYDLSVRTASTGSNAKIHFDLDGAAITSAITLPNTGGWQSFATTTRSVNLPAGQHVLRLMMDAAGSNGAISNINWLKIGPPNQPPPPPPPPPSSQQPFKGSPFAIGSTPATIQAEDFDNGGEGIAYHDVDATNSGGATYRSATAPGVDIETTGDSGGGNHIGFTAAGEWLEYTINVATAGNYNFDFRVASNGTGGKFRVLIDGVDKTGQIQIPSSGGWNVFTTISKSNVNLPAGQHVLRLAFDTAGASGFAGNFNWFRITQAPGSSTTLTSTTSAYARGGGSAGTNFGSDPTLVVKKHTDPAFARESFIKFDLSSIAAINSAKLRLFGSLNDTSSTSVQAQVSGSANSSWNESTVNWTTRPASAGNALATVTVTGTTDQWYEFDVTNFLKAEKAAGRNTVTLILKNPFQHNALVVFNSDDAGTNRPQLGIS